MFSNNPKIASFYPTAKRPTNFYQNTNLVGNNNIYNNEKFNIFNKNESNNISDSVELALITVNLSYARFKTMEREELENYIKTMAYNNGYDSKKYLLSLNILMGEFNKIQQSYIIRQDLYKEQNKPKTALENTLMVQQKFNINELAVIEPDEFNLNIPVIPINKTPTTNFIFKNDTNFDNLTQQSQNFSIKQNKNLDMSTYSGNPFGVTKITNNNPVSSVRPINQINKFNIDNSNTIDKSNSLNTESLQNHNRNYYTDNDNMTFNSQNTNNIIKQTSFIQNPSSVISSGGKRRTSNLDVGTSNNYIIIQ